RWLAAAVIRCSKPWVQEQGSRASSVSGCQCHERTLAPARAGPAHKVGPVSGASRDAVCDRSIRRSVLVHVALAGVGEREVVVGIERAIFRIAIADLEVAR